MKIHNVQQGSPEWIQLRAQYFTASEAPAMMGCSPYMTRNELLRQKHTGITQDVDAAKQRLFDSGHETEAMFRPIAERLVGDDLYPVTGSIELSDDQGTLRLLASFDGLTMDYSVGFEHKLYSEENANAIFAFGEPPIYHCWQLEQQMLVSGAAQILFITSDGTEEKLAHCWYESDPQRRAALIAGWKQFSKDLASYVPREAEAPKPVGKAPETLPALRIEVTGMVTASNLAEFRATALTAIRCINRELSTDQDFANAEKSVKWCDEVETRLKAAKEHAQSQSASIDELFKTIDDISAEARRVRLDLDKLVKARKEAIKHEIVAEGIAAMQTFVGDLNAAMPSNYMPTIPTNFSGVIKGLRTVESIRNAVDTELAQAKIAANEVANRIHANLKTIKESGLVVHDAPSLVLKAPDDLAAVIAQRKAAEVQRQEQERERIRAEEAARLERQAQAKAAEEERAVVTAPPVAPQTRQFSVGTGARLKLGDINALLSPISLTADGLAQLGFTHVATDKSAKLYLAADFNGICLALARKIEAACRAKINERITDKINEEFHSGLDGDREESLANQED